MERREDLRKVPATERSGFSRRTFLRGMALTAATIPATGAGVAAAAAAAAAGRQDSSKTKTLGPGPVEITLQVNGEARTLRVEPRVTLLDAIRDRLELTGPKRVCDRGSCGACTVLLDDAPVYACSILAVEAQGRRIETVEGIAQAEGELGPVAAAFCEKDALMCGFCTPGFVVAGEAARRAGTAGSLEQIRRSLDGNVCRCGTYVRVFEAVSAAAGADTGSATGAGAGSSAGGGR